MPQTASIECWIAALARAGKSFGRSVDEQSIRQQMRWCEQLPLTRRLERMGYLMGMSVSLQQPEKIRWRNEILPALFEIDQGGVLVIESIKKEGKARFWLNDGGEIRREELLTQLLTKAQGDIVLLGAADRGQDPRVDGYVKPYRAHWFWRNFRGTGRQIGEITLASVIGNALALAGILFSMQVYDRVIPAQSFPTLWVLFFGVVMAAALEYAIRLSRTVISDLMGKKIDLKVSSLLFAHALAIKNDSRPKSTGSFIAQLREIDQMRELLASTTLSAAADMPFVLLFIGVIAMVGGPLAFIPLLAIPLIVIPGIVLQWPMARLAKQGMRESALRNAVLVESIEGVEDIKALQAEPYFQRQWEHTHAVSANIGIRQRAWGARLSGWAAAIQQLSFAGMLVFGSYRVLSGDITTGTLVACSLLSSRTIAPLMQLTMVFSRWQHAKTAMTGLDELLKKPLDKPVEDQMAHCPALCGHYLLHNLQYSYDVEKGPNALIINALEIKPGERVAILGNVGAGKSTLLKLLSGQITATGGKIIIDGVDVAHIDPVDLRRQVGYLSQESRLFFGSLRQNLMLGHPHATEPELLQALGISGALDMVRQDAASLDRIIHEGGKGLSGGQRQMVLLSRTLLRNPQIVLLDEPTASMDATLEMHVIRQMQSWLAGRTLVLVTHRPALLQLVSRVVVLDQGRIIADGPRDHILQAAGKSKNDRGVA